ncbi:flavin reductase [Robiginitalea sp. SC105]|uniref:flavin reductase n=1 Tax=Robiginitalea sp. SC105 TaxID=2762332 RepID=UPI0016397338|nr:flavin reductase [Robiginitalea sp. SC105]MBC2839553.1 flavin reductase [Robiginitalea sp. SC105]
MSDGNVKHIERIATEAPVWQRFFMIAPLAVIGTLEGEGYDLAPKHMVTPMGFDNYFGFVCSPEHGTYKNIQEGGGFSVSFPKPDQTLIAALSASPRQEALCKSDQVLRFLPTVRLPETDIPFLSGSYLMLDCEHFRTLDGFGRNSLITGRIRNAYVDRDYLRMSERDEQQMLREHPLLAYVAEGRFARVAETYSFPFPKGFKR